MKSHQDTKVVFTKPYTLPWSRYFCTASPEGPNSLALAKQSQPTFSSLFVPYLVSACACLK